MSSSEGLKSLGPLQRDVELSPDAPEEPLLNKLSDNPDPPRATKTARTSARRFERPNYLHIVAHVVWCCAAYPIIHAGTIIVKDVSLFWARAIVGVWCSGIGLVIGWSLMAFATKYAEAATWATVIHLSHGDNGQGIKLRDLAHKAHQPESALSGVRLLWTRFSNRGTDRRSRRAVDSRPWSLFITFYVILMLATATLPFILGRVIIISTRLERQLRTYTETTIWGDLSESDTRAADARYLFLASHVEIYTLVSLTDRSSLPPPVRLKYNGDDVYFAELVQSQLKSDGKGLGTFLWNRTVFDVYEPTIPSTEGLLEGSLLKTPRWGIRMHCEKLPEPEKYLVPRSNDGYTYVIVTKAFLENLYSSFSLPLPDTFKTSEFVFVSPNDTLPSSVSEEEVAYVAKFEDDGRAHSLEVHMPFDIESGNGWIGTETVLVRLEDSYAPNASFPVWSEDPIGDASGFSSRIGYDAAVCVEMYESWIVQIYNSSLGVPTTMAIVCKSATTDFEPDDGNTGPRLDSYTRALNSTGKTVPYYFSYSDAITQMAKDNDPQLRYAPSPTTVSFTGNIGLDGYTELSPQIYADVRGKIDASSVLPFLSGTRPIVVRAYKDEFLASASFDRYTLGGVLGIVLLLGTLAGLFVPALPFDVPRRGFGLFSWVAVMHGRELGGEFWQDNVNRHMDLDELEKTVGEERVHFII